MRGNLLIVALLIAALAPFTHAETEAEGNTLNGEFLFAAGVRNPAQESRIEVLADGTADTLTNPFDFEYILGFDGYYGPFSFMMNETWRRENARKYWNHEAQADYKHQYAKTGIRFRKDNGTGIELLNMYLEAVIKNWVGVGSSYSWNSFKNEAGNFELGGGKLFARLSLAKEHHTFMGVDLTVRASYEYNPDRYRIFGYMDVRNLTKGRYALVPFFKWERMATKGQDPKDAYQARVSLRISI